MPEVNFERQEPVACHLFRDEPLQGSGQPQLAEALLDRDLPATRQAQQALRLGILDRLPGCCGKNWGIGHPPQKCVGVQQEVRHRYSSKSSRVSSKSGASHTSPRAEPGWRGCRVSFKGTRRSTGLLSLAMMTSSPSRAR